MGAHAKAVDAGIGAARRMHGDPFAGDGEDGVLHRLLHARSMGLPLLAHAGAAIEFDGEGETGYRSEEHTSELQSLMRIPYAVICSKNTKISNKLQTSTS